MEQFASPEQLSEKDRFLHVFGKALAAWAEVEHQLSLWFGEVVGISADLAQDLFFTNKGFNARIELLKAALERRPPPEWNYFLDEAVRRSVAYSAARNRLAHGTMHPNALNELGHPVDWRLKEPAEWQQRVGLSFGAVDLIATNFKSLAAIIREGYVRHALEERSLDCHRRLLHLPGVADSTEPNQKQTERLNRLVSLRTSPLEK